MKAISLWQPWASAIALGYKRIETRGWSTPYRGTLAIHAAKTTVGMEMARRGTALELEHWISTFGIGRQGLSGLFAGLPLGAVIATCRLVDVVPADDAGIQAQLDEWRSAVLGRVRERDFGDYRPGRFAWLLADVVPLAKPWPCRGRQKVFDVPPLTQMTQ